MLVKVLFFASCRDIAGTREARLQVPDGASVSDLRGELAARFPGLRPLMSVVSVAVNAEYAQDDAVLAAGDEVALVPPVSGGCR